MASLQDHLRPLGATELLALARNTSVSYGNRRAAVELMLERKYRTVQHPEIAHFVVAIQAKIAEPEPPTVEDEFVIKLTPEDEQLWEEVISANTEIPVNGIEPAQVFDPSQSEEAANLMADTVDPAPALSASFTTQNLQ